MNQQDRSSLEGLEQFRAPKMIFSTPHLRDLHNHITPNYATRWRVIGTQLGLNQATLDIIEYDYRDKAGSCCNVMLKKWLEVDPSASWKKLLEVIASPGVSMATDQTDQGTNAAVYKLFERVREISEQTRCAADESAWPPNQLKSFVPLLFVPLDHSDALAQLQVPGSISNPNSTPQSKRRRLDSHETLREELGASKITEQLADILAPLEESNKPQFILVEGLPGIGKSFLLQEVLYRWSTKNLLQKFNLVLFVQLHNPAVQQASLIDNLLEPFFIGDQKATENVAACSSYLFRNSGKDLVILFDGYDELPEHLQKDSLVAKILKLQVLPRCSLAVSSRPHASAELRQLATVKVNILGFGTMERNRYISQSLEGHPQKIEELTEYFECHPTINSLCYIPFIMVALLYMYKQGVKLPENSVELYECLICFICISQHNKIYGNSYKKDITSLTELPDRCKTIVKELAGLAFKALNDNKSSFTLEEMKKACPKIEVTKGAINGFGLLQSVQHFSITSTTMKFNFLHLSIQEFLAAYHVSQLPANEKLIVFEEKFWSDNHASMFSIYAALTNGQQPEFKQFLQQSSPQIPQSSNSGILHILIPQIRQKCQQVMKHFVHDRNGAGNNVISEKILNDPIKSLRLFRCFHDAKDESYCESIKQAKWFNNAVINLGSTRCSKSADVEISTYDLECTTLFFTYSPNKVWKNLNLRHCHIQDHGIYVLYRGMYHSNIIIKELNLSGNDLTKSSSSSISDLTIQCKVEELRISGNHTIGEDSALYKILSDPSSKLVRLDISCTSLSNHSAKFLFTELAKGNKLQGLNISHNPITDEACDVIAVSLEDNTSLIKLWINDSKISAEAAQRLVDKLKVIYALNELRLPRQYSEDAKQKIRSLRDKVIKNRESRECQTKLKIEHW